MSDGQSLAAKLPKLGFGPVRKLVDYSRLCVFVVAPLLSPNGGIWSGFSKAKRTVSPLSHPLISFSPFLCQSLLGPPILPCPLSVVDGAWVEWSGGWERRKASEKLLALLSALSDKAQLFSGVHNGTLQHFKTCLYLWISLRLRNSCLSGFHHCCYG